MTTEEIGQDEPQTALLLTEQEWADLAVICSGYKHTARTEPLDTWVRRQALAERIIEASGW